MAEEPTAAGEPQAGTGEPTPQAGAAASESGSPGASEAGGKTFDESVVKDLRSEAAGWRTKLREAEAKVQEFEKAKADADKKQLEEQGKFKELAAKAEAERDAAREELQRTRLEHDVIVAAGRQGCIDPDYVVYAIAKHADTLPDDQKVDIDKFIAKLKKEKPPLFGQAPASGPVTTEVGGKATGKPDLSKMSYEDKAKHILHTAAKEGRLDL
jgi:hypothetical protein